MLGELLLLLLVTLLASLVLVETLALPAMDKSWSVLELVLVLVLVLAPAPFILGP